jgi:RNA recognition motif-containing protein
MPCRTLFVRNLGYRADGRKIEAAFAKHGAIKDVSDLIEKRGLMFITFYDIRHAEAAMSSLNGAVVENRKLDVHYSLPKQDVNVHGACTKENNQVYISLPIFPKSSL